MHEKVRHRMTSLFSVCPPITCIIGFMVKCAWIGTSDINYPPWPFLWWVIGIFSLSLIIRFCFSQKRSFLPKSSCPVYQTFQPGEDSSAHAWTSDPIKTNTAPYFSCHEQKTTITDEKIFMVFIEFFFRIFKILRIFIFLKWCFMNWERDSASAKIDDWNWWWLIRKTHF